MDSRERTAPCDEQDDNDNIRRCSRHACTCTYAGHCSSARSTCARATRQTAMPLCPLRQTAPMPPPPRPMPSKPPRSEMTPRAAPRARRRCTRGWRSTWCRAAGRCGAWCCARSFCTTSGAATSGLSPHQPANCRASWQRVNAARAAAVCSYCVAEKATGPAALHTHTHTATHKESVLVDRHSPLSLVR